MEETYYDILGVSKTATAEEIQTAYRALIKKWHPDKFANSSDEEKKKAEEMSRKINEAYSTLSDPTLRQEYDNPQPKMDGFDGGSWNPFDFFRNEMFGNNQKRTIRGSHVKITLNVSVQDLYKPITKKVKYKINESNGNACPKCKGSGMHYRNIRGMTIGEPCSYCDGLGLETKQVDHECEFTINGIDGNASFDEAKSQLYVQHVVPFEGNVVSSNRNENGNLIVSLIVNIPRGFVMESAIDVARSIDVPVLTAIVGGEVEVGLINGQKVKYKVKGGSKEGTRVRFAQKGLPSKSMIGDMYGYIHLVLPKSLTDEERQIIEELKTHKNFS